MKNIITISLSLFCLGILSPIEAMQGQQKKPAAVKIIAKKSAAKAPALKKAAAQARVVKPAAAKAPAAKKQTAKTHQVKKAPKTPPVKPAAPKAPALKPATLKAAVVKAAGPKTEVDFKHVIIFPVVDYEGKALYMVARETQGTNKGTFSGFEGDRKQNEKSHRETAERILKEQAPMLFTVNEAAHYLDPKKGLVFFIAAHESSASIVYIIAPKEEQIVRVKPLFAKLGNTVKDALALVKPDEMLKTVAQTSILNYNGSEALENITLQLPNFIREMVKKNFLMTKEKNFKVLYDSRN